MNKQELVVMIEKYRKIKTELLNDLQKADEYEKDLCNNFESIITSSILSDVELNESNEREKIALEIGEVSSQLGKVRDIITQRIKKVDEVLDILSNLKKE